MQSTPAENTFYFMGNKTRSVSHMQKEPFCTSFTTTIRQRQSQWNQNWTSRCDSPPLLAAPTNPARGLGRTSVKEDTAISFTLTHVTWRFKKYLREEPGIISLLQAPAVGTLRKLDQLPWLPPSASSALLHLPSPSVISFFCLLSSHTLWGWFTYLLTN